MWITEANSANLLKYSLIENFSSDMYFPAQLQRKFGNSFFNTVVKIIEKFHWRFSDIIYIIDQHL